MQDPAFPAGITRDDIDRSAELVYGDPTEPTVSDAAPYWSPPSYVAMKRHPEGFTPSRVRMHDGVRGGWSGLGHQLTCDLCGWSEARQYAADVRQAAHEHTEEPCPKWQAWAEASARGELWEASQVTPQ